MPDLPLTRRQIGPFGAFNLKALLLIPGRGAFLVSPSPSRSTRKQSHLRATQRGSGDARRLGLVSNPHSDEGCEP
jgi:hypothetical protein